jgi:hypothetical protein
MSGGDREGAKSVMLPDMTLQEQVMKNSQLMEEFSGDDDHSIEFSIDPDMYKKLNVLKARKGEENALDLEKLYNFQLERDISKLIEKKGSYRERKKNFLETRETDPFYQSIAAPTNVGAKGQFTEINSYVVEESWRSSSQPYGIIAHKRYLEYIKNLPKGPSLEEIKDRTQRRMDKELWEKVVTGKFELTRRDYIRMEEQLLRREVADNVRDQINFHEQRKKDREQAFKENRFEEMRLFGTKREYEKSINNWNRGIHEKYDLEKGMPFIVHDIASVQEMKLRSVEDDQGPRGPPTFTSERFISGSYGQEKQYSDYLAGGNLVKAEEFLKHQRKKMEKEKKLKAIEDKEKARTRRRVAQAGFAIADQVMNAKMANVAENLRFTVQVEKDAKKKGRIEVDFLLQGSYENSDADQIFEDSMENKMLLPEIKALEVLDEVKLDGDSASDSDDGSSSSSSSSSASKSKKDPPAGGEEENRTNPSSPQSKGHPNTDGLVGIHQAFMSPDKGGEFSLGQQALYSLQTGWLDLTQRLRNFKSSAVVPLSYLDFNHEENTKSKNKQKPKPKKKENTANNGPTLKQLYDDGELNRETFGEWVGETMPGVSEYFMSV